MRRRARKAPPDADMVERVLDRLAASQLVDDREFAAFWIENRERFNPRSARAMTVELRQLGVDRETAEAAIAPERDAVRAVSACEWTRYSLRNLDIYCLHGH